MLDDQPRQAQTCSRGQQGVSVENEGLRVVMWLLDISTSRPEAFAIR